MYVPMSSAGTVSEELELPPQPHKARAHRPRIEADVDLTLRLRPSLAADTSLSEACAQRGTPTPLVRKRETKQPGPVVKMSGSALRWRRPVLASYLRIEERSCCARDLASVRLSPRGGLTAWSVQSRITTYRRRRRNTARGYYGYGG